MPAGSIDQLAIRRDEANERRGEPDLRDDDDIGVHDVPELPDMMAGAEGGNEAHLANTAIDRLMELVDGAAQSVKDGDVQRDKFDTKMGLVVQALNDVGQGEKASQLQNYIETITW